MLTRFQYFEKIWKICLPETVESEETNRHIRIKMKVGIVVDQRGWQWSTKVFLEQCFIYFKVSHFRNLKNIFMHCFVVNYFFKLDRGKICF